MTIVEQPRELQFVAVGPVGERNVEPAVLAVASVVEVPVVVKAHDAGSYEGVVIVQPVVQLVYLAAVLPRDVASTEQMWAHERALVVELLLLLVMCYMEPWKRQRVTVLLLLLLL